MEIISNICELRKRFSTERKVFLMKNKLSISIFPQSSQEWSVCRRLEGEEKKRKKRAGRFMANNLPRLKETRFFTRAAHTTSSKSSDFYVSSVSNIIFRRLTKSQFIKLVVMMFIFSCLAKGKRNRKQRQGLLFKNTSKYQS